MAAGFSFAEAPTTGLTRAADSGSLSFEVTGAPGIAAAGTTAVLEVLPAPADSRPSARQPPAGHHLAVHYQAPAPLPRPGQYSHSEVERY
jgi:hypothetical protein